MIRNIIIILVFLSMSGYAIYQQTNGQRAVEQSVETEVISKQGLEIGKEAPNFTLLSTNGDRISLSSFKGKKVIVNFWATWCPPCKEEMPVLQTFFEKKDENTVLLAINYTVSERTNGEQKVRSFMHDNGYTFPVLLDSSSLVVNTYQIISLPTSYFIDSKGIIRQKYVGAMTPSFLEQTISTIR